MAMVKSKRELEILIQRIGGYTKPKLKLEQYVTDAGLVAEVVWVAYMRGDVEDKAVADVACGTGRFAAAASIMGARHVLCIDLDPEALADAKRYLRELGADHAVDYVAMDASMPGISREIDTVFQNPPFGIWSGKGSDVKILLSSIRISKVTYSIHKAGTEQYIGSLVKSLGYEYEVQGGFTITIPHTYRHHRKPRRIVEVFVIRISKPDIM